MLGTLTVLLTAAWSAGRNNKGYESPANRSADNRPHTGIHAQEGDVRCRSFVKMWHRALAAATANITHLDGPGRVYLTGPNCKFVDLSLLNLYLHEMAKMSTLQGTVFEVLPTNDEIAILGAAFSAAKT